MCGTIIIVNALKSVWYNYNSECIEVCVLQL